MAVAIWLVLGDSISQGMAPRLQSASTTVVGISGSSYWTWVRYGWVTMQVAETKPDVVVLALGTNPDKPPIPEGFAEDVRTAISQAERFGAEVVIVGPFASDDSKLRLAVLRSIMPDAIDGYELASGLPRAGVGDVHFTSAGYEALAGRVRGAVQKVLDGRRHQRGLPGWVWGAAAAVVVATVGIMLLRRTR